MTTIEQRNYSQVIPRPTDLSLKSSLNSKYCAQRRLAQYDNQRHVMVRTPPGPTDLFNEQPCATDNVNWSKHSAASPIALVFGGTSLSTVTTTMATTPMLDSAARLVVLDSILSRQSDTRSTSRAIYDLPSKRCRGESESSSDGMPPSSTSPSGRSYTISLQYFTTEIVNAMYNHQNLSCLLQCNIFFQELELMLVNECIALKTSIFKTDSVLKAGSP